MTQYSIKDLERISSMKAHTIRIWELRYGLLKPERTDTNIRYYDDEQLKKLLNVCALMGEGMKISKISELTNQQIYDEIEKLILKSSSSDIHIETIVNQLLIAVSTFDEILFEKVFSNALLRFGLLDTYLKVLYPLLVRVGLMWTKDDIMPAQEHFLSNLIKQKLFASIDSMPIPQKSDQTWVLFLCENEDHEIGLLFANYILRAHGKRVIYLGQRVPYANLSKIIDSCSPTHIYTFFVRNHQEKDISELLKNIGKNYKKVKICVSGRQAIVENATQKNKVLWIKNIENLLEMLEK